MRSVMRRPLALISVPASATVIRELGGEGQRAERHGHPTRVVEHRRGHPGLPEVVLPDADPVAAFPGVGQHAAQCRPATTVSGVNAVSPCRSISRSTSAVSDQARKAA